MNADRRRGITRCGKSLADIRGELESIAKRIEVNQNTLQDILDEEDEARDNMPESLIGGHRYEVSEEASEHLGEALSNLEEVSSMLDDVVSELDEAVSVK